MSEYTPTIGEIRALYVRETARGESRNLGELIAEFDRWLAAHDSKVRAETLREAAAVLYAGRAGRACNPACHAADQTTLRMRADQIEREAALT